MGLVPDRSRKILSARNANFPWALRRFAVCDLDLYPELGQPGRGVLVVTHIANITAWRDGKNADGSTAAWSGDDKTVFKDMWCRIVSDMWSEQHRITTGTANAMSGIVDIGVIFDLKISEAMAAADHSHVNLEVTKVEFGQPKGAASNTGNVVNIGVKGCSLRGIVGGGPVWNDSARLRYIDIFPGNDLGGTAVAHEFGHMLGYRDEYPSAPWQRNDAWTGDTESIMYAGRIVRERHYTLFAAWLDAQYRRRGPLWKVNGRTDITNAGI
ncbi:hypothetical protein [Vineibacter terrae]|uniref:hypothetical protein n=1 Tax=Vineibacter terrae TaxID=2586908 RepID=UPI002E303D13|nr:hypothetical protein [Vineibacter terrae]HEX2891413.1 hypothetical protein [Vineibacter terrae]